eukprot:1828943-Alexandrium_andersonii.AAC.1
MLAVYYFEERDFRWNDPNDGAYVKHRCAWCVAADHDLRNKYGRLCWYKGVSKIKEIDGVYDRERSKRYKEAITTARE